jgi:hypothetical protein
MSEDIRKMIDNIKNFGKLSLNESKENNGLIPINKKERYNDNDGAYEIITYFDTKNNSIITDTLDGYTQKQSPSIDFDFLKQNESKIKNILIDKIIEDDPSIINGFNLGDGKYNIPVNIKNSKKYKGKTAKLVEIFSKYDSYSHRTVSVAKIIGDDGNEYNISPNTITISIDTIRHILMNLKIESLFVFRKSNRDNKYYFI